MHLLGCLIIASATGCASHFIVRSTFVEADQSTSLPDIIKTPAYDRTLPSVRRVAIRAPDACTNESAAEGRGDSERARHVLQIDCGVEMNILERALVRSGFTLVSWDAVRPGLGKTTLDSARELGVDILFQINSLEHMVVTVGKDAHWERKFFNSNSRGKPGAPARLSEYAISTLEKVIEPSEARATSGQRIGVEINASAILVETGEAIWFFSGQVLQQYAHREFVELLVRCAAPRNAVNSAKRDLRCKQVFPAGSERAPDPGPALRSFSFEDASEEAESADFLKAAYFDLMRALVDDLVRAFAQSDARPVNGETTSPP